MSTIELLLSQVAISLVVMAIYHVWQSGGKQTAPPVSAPIVSPPPPLVEKVAIPLLVAPHPKTEPVAEAMPPEILAIIAAAVSVVLGEQYRMVSVQPSAAPMPEVNVWALEGRLDQFQSHRVR